MKVNLLEWVTGPASMMLPQQPTDSISMLKYFFNVLSPVLSPSL